MKKRSLKNIEKKCGLLCFLLCIAVAPIMNSEAVSVGAVANEGTAENDNGTDTVNLSSNADLKTFKLSPGKLSPDFSANTTEYEFTLNEDMMQVVLKAKTKDSNAKIISSSGFANLSIGTNLAVLNVKAADGTIKSYRVSIIKESGKNNAVENLITANKDTDGNIPVEGQNLVVNSTIPDNLIPDGCTKVQYVYKNNYVEGALFAKGELMLLYLTDENGNQGDFHIYYSGTDEFVDFVQIKSVDGQFVFPVQYPIGIPVPSGFGEGSIQLSGKTIDAYIMDESTSETNYSELEEEVEEEPAYDIPSTEEYFMFFGISSNGNNGWYLYDTVEKTCQRYLEPAEDSGNGVGSFNNESYVTYKLQSQKRMIVICVLIFVIALLLAVILNLLLKMRNNNDKIEEEEEIDEEETDEKLAEIIEDNIVEEQDPNVEDDSCQEVSIDEISEQKEEQPYHHEEEAALLDDDFEFEFINIRRK